MDSPMEILLRETLKKDLSQCTEDQQYMFKRLYSSQDLNASIETIIDFMPGDKLDWAMKQVGNTLEKNLRSIPKQRTKESKNVR